MDNKTTSGAFYACESKPSKGDIALGVFGVLLFVTGTVGNFLVIFVRSRGWIRQPRSSTYQVALAVTDQGAVFTGLLRHIVTSFSGWDWGWNSYASCKFYLWFQYSLQFGASWILVAYNVQRAISVVFPLKVRTTEPHDQWVILAVLILAIAVSSNTVFIFYHGLDERQCPGCKSDYIYYLFNVLPILTASFDLIIPSVIFFTTNIIIFVTLRRRNRTLHEVSTTQLTSTFRSSTRLESQIPDMSAKDRELAGEQSMLAHDHSMVEDSAVESRPLERSAASRLEGQSPSGALMQGLPSPSPSQRLFPPLQEFIMPVNGSRRTEVNEPNAMFFVLIMINIAYILFTLPRNLFFIFYGRHVFETYEKYQMWKLSFRLTDVIGFGVNSTNFYIYCLSSKTFRTDLRKAIQRNWRR